MEVETFALPPPSSPGMVLPSLTKNRAPRPVQRKPTLRIKAAPIFPSDDEPESVQLSSPKNPKITAMAAFSPKTSVQSPLQPPSAMKKGNPPIPFVLPPITGKVELRPVNKAASIPKHTGTPRPSIASKPTGLRRFEKEEPKEEEQGLLKKDELAEKLAELAAAGREDEREGEAAGGRLSDEKVAVKEVIPERKKVEKVEEEPLLHRKAEAPKKALPPTPIATAQIPKARSLPSPARSPAGSSPTSWFGGFFSWVWDFFSSFFR